jgi:hypothetical protein
MVSEADRTSPTFCKRLEEEDRSNGPRKTSHLVTEVPSATRVSSARIPKKSAISTAEDKIIYYKPSYASPAAELQAASEQVIDIMYTNRIPCYFH